MDLMLNLLIKVSAISAVGDLEAIAISIPLSLSAYTMPLACGYNDGISRLERHSLQKKKTKTQMKKLDKKNIYIYIYIKRERERERENLRYFLQEKLVML